jgi:mannose-6-phosphate isomerase-like protein (cupin superfamily)
MRNLLFILSSLFLLPCSLLRSQVNIQSLDTIQAPAGTENIYSKPLYHDSLSSSFCIIVKKEVKKHYHATHSEQIYVIAGEADMMIGDRPVHIKKGDVLFIPKGTTHSVKVSSSEPLKILSVQAPYFDGKDRILVE